MLVIYYYKRQPLPLMVAIARRFVIFYLAIFKHFAVGNAGRIPVGGPVIFVANHSTAYDPLCLQAASNRRLIQFMMAKEYYEKKPIHYILKWLRVIPVNRTGNDTASIRTALRSLAEGSCIGMFPEGKISENGRMNEGRQGVALLALMSKATVVPAYIQGTEAYKGMVKDFLCFNKVTLLLRPASSASTTWAAAAMKAHAKSPPSASWMKSSACAISTKKIRNAACHPRNGLGRPWHHGRSTAKSRRLDSAPQQPFARSVKTFQAKISGQYGDGEFNKHASRSCIWSRSL